MSASVKLVNNHLAVKARLVPPNDNGYLLHAAEIGAWRGPFPLPSRERTRLLDDLKTVIGQLVARQGVEEVTTFRAILRPPGEGSQVLDDRQIRHARYDIVVLIRTGTVQDAKALREDPDYKTLVDALQAAARHVHVMVARNAARIEDVDHRPDHPFLFNYFYADDNNVLFDVWNYTAGWFQEKTQLPNSTLLQPLEGELATHGIINHASWPNLRTFLPSLIFRPSFRSFVLANFKANGIAAQPIIYRRIL